MGLLQGRGTIDGMLEADEKASDANSMENNEERRMGMGNLGNLDDWLEHTHTSDDKPTRIRTVAQTHPPRMDCAQSHRL